MSREHVEVVERAHAAWASSDLATFFAFLDLKDVREALDVVGLPE